MIHIGFLLAQAEEAGLEISVEGDKVKVRGPYRLQDLGKLVLDRKVEVLRWYGLEPFDRYTELREETLRSGSQWKMEIYRKIYPDALKRYWK